MFSLWEGSKGWWKKKKWQRNSFLFLMKTQDLLFHVDARYGGSVTESAEVWGSIVWHHHVMSLFCVKDKADKWKKTEWQKTHNVLCWFHFLGFPQMQDIVVWQQNYSNRGFVVWCDITMSWLVSPCIGPDLSSIFSTTEC